MHVAQFDQPRRQSCRHPRMVRIGMDQEAWPRDWRERYACHQLRIILPTGVFERMRPAVVKNVLALAMRLQIGRHCADHSAGVVLQNQVLRAPTFLFDRGARVFERRQKRMADKRVVPARASVPGVSADLAYAGHNFQCNGRLGAVGHRYCSSIRPTFGGSCNCDAFQRRSPSTPDRHHRSLPLATTTACNGCVRPRNGSSVAS